MPPNKSELMVKNVQYAASFNSDPTQVETLGFAILAKWTEDVATLAGTIKLQASVDTINWNDIINSTVTISGSGSHLWNVTTAGYFYIRVAYTRTTGTGTFYVMLNTKREGQ